MVGEIYDDNYLVLYSVSPRINITGGEVHQWYMTFDQQCSISIVKHYIST